MSVVYLSKCNDYDLNAIKRFFHKTFNELEEQQVFLKSSQRVYLKVNGLAPFPKEKAITTHPVFVKAMIQVLKERGINQITVGDNPAVRDMISVFKKCGIYDVCMEEKVKISDTANLTTISNENGILYKMFEVSEEMMSTDVLINLPKLKTHSFTYLTCAQKNLFGTIYGLSKAGWHVKASDPMSFGEAMNDLYGAIVDHFSDKTLLHFCDGILALEGDGPSTGGSPKHFGALIASLDAVSLDRVALEIAKLDPNKSFINVIAQYHNYGLYNIDEIRLVGTRLEDFESHFLIPPTKTIPALSLLKIQAIKNMTLEYPVIQEDICIRCGECAKICPPHTMSMAKGEYPILDSSKCIRCWCCQEVCPQNAIKTSKRPLLGKLILKNRKS
jgi:uncharacterized protein (DUF362 family)/ferredoxin